MFGDDGSNFDNFNLTVKDSASGAPKWKPIEDIFINEEDGLFRELSYYLEPGTEFPVTFSETENVISRGDKTIANWVSINSNSGRITGLAPEVNEDITEYFFVTAVNSKGRDSASFKITTKDVFISADPPQWNQIQDQYFNEGGVIRIETNRKLISQAAIAFNNIPTDEDGNSIEWEPPAWLNISTDGTGIITGTAPFVDQEEIYPIYLLAINRSDIFLLGLQMVPFQ